MPGVESEAFIADGTFTEAQLRLPSLMEPCRKFRLRLPSPMELECPYAGSVETVGMTPWVKELKNRNNAVGSLIQERFDESASKSDVVLKEAHKT